MTPEELNRTMEFIVASQARLAAAQEQDRLDRIEFEKWARNMNSQLVDLQRQQAELLVHQSERLDSFQKSQDQAHKSQGEAVKQNRVFQAQAIRLLNMILDRLPPLTGHA